MRTVAGILDEIAECLLTECWSAAREEKISGLFDSLNNMDLTYAEEERLKFLITKF